MSKLMSNIVLNIYILFIMCYYDKNGKWKILYILFFRFPKIQGVIYMMFIADSIKQEYEKWTEGDVVFISSPTGSGKTTFVINTLLPYLRKKGKRVLYLVNRTILKEQLENEIRNLPYDLKNMIQVELYQTIERTMLEAYLWNNDYYRRKVNWYSAFDYVVCDEAHYFLMDSNYNTNTMLSYDYIRSYYYNKIRIYMSATIEEIREVIEEDLDNKYIQTQWLKFNLDPYKDVNLYKHNRYKYPKDSYTDIYNYIDIHVLKDCEEITDVVVGNSKKCEKWLIFVDSRKFGNILKKDIMKAAYKSAYSITEDDIVFVTSDYDLDQKSFREVKDIASNNRQTAKILIVTSVLDNGINLNDIELRNVIIIADLQNEFLQMLGRKRTDGQRLNLYIVKQTKGYFSARLDINNRKRNIAGEYYKKLLYLRDYFNDILKTEGVSQDTMKKINERENIAIYEQHKMLMKDIMDGKIKFEDVRASFWACAGTLYLNFLSFKNLENINKYYVELLSEFDKYGEDAFVREQLRWLGIVDEDAQRIIGESKISRLQKAKQKVIDAFNENVDKKMDMKANRELKNRIRGELQILVEGIDDNNADKKKYLDAIKKNDRVISKFLMRFLSDYCDIPFEMSEEGKSIYILKAIK